MDVQSKAEPLPHIMSNTGRSRSLGSALGTGFVAFMLFVYLIAVVYPLIWMLMSSLKDTMEMYTGAWALPQQWLFSNYRSAWELGVSAFFTNSVIITVLTVIVTVTVSISAAYALSIFRFKGRELFLFVVATGLMFSPQVSLIPLYGLIQHLGIYNTYWSLVLPYAAYRMPIIILLIRAFFLGIPKDFAESAYLDGLLELGRAAPNLFADQPAGPVHGRAAHRLFCME
ncbi:carbohydrate ABC transporter permease [Paenibacillus sp. P25]|nr:carbohydrate ABC transporter permease [Paenibacillus sp. P25]